MMAIPSCLREKWNPTISDEIRRMHIFVFKHLDIKNIKFTAQGWLFLLIWEKNEVLQFPMKSDGSTTLYLNIRYKKYKIYNRRIAIPSSLREKWNTTISDEIRRMYNFVFKHSHIKNIKYTAQWWLFLLVWEKNEILQFPMKSNGCTSLYLNI